MDLDYPKPVMKLNELVKMGLGREMLLRIYRMEGQAIAWKDNPLSKNSPIRFYTDKLDEYIRKQIKLQNAGIQRGRY